MYMFYGAETALKLRCPKCGGNTGHETNRNTNEEICGLNDKTNRVFKSIVDHHASHRLRTRKCYCGKTFDLIITQYENVQALIIETLRAQHEAVASDEKLKVFEQNLLLEKNKSEAKDAKITALEAELRQAKEKLQGIFALSKNYQPQMQAVKKVVRCAVKMLPDGCVGAPVI